MKPLTILLAVPWLLLAGCGGARKSRVVAGNYCLDEMFGGDHYNLTGCSILAKLKGRTDNGPLDGIVEKLGWDRRFIIAWRHALSRNEPDGWVVLDTVAETMGPVLSEQGLAQRLKESPELAAIKVHPVREAWNLLAAR
jgi:hypothetical protein